MSVYVLRYIYECICIYVQVYDNTGYTHTHSYISDIYLHTHTWVMCVMYIICIYYVLSDMNIDAYTCWRASSSARIYADICTMYINLVVHMNIYTSHISLMYECICIYHVLSYICIYIHMYAECGNQARQQESMQIYVPCTCVTWYIWINIYHTYH